MTETLVFSSTATVTDQRLIEGVAVPYDTVTTDGRNVRFAKGAFGDLNSQSLASVLIQHPFSAGVPAKHIGRVESWTDSDSALLFSARLNETPEANEIYAALKAGELGPVSVGVYVSEANEGEDGITTFSSASLLEISIIVEGNAAFSDSKILAVFADQTEVQPQTDIKENHMESENQNEVAELREDVAELSRSFSVFTDENNSSNTAPQFSCFGEVVKGVADGDEAAIAAITAFAYTGGVSADTNIKQSWAAPLIKIVDLGRPVLSLFDKLPDPKTNVIEYLKLNTNTINVAEQVLEGDDLAYGRINLTSEVTKMLTYGGWTDFSLQQLQRSDVSVVDLAYRALASKYAQVTEAAVRGAFLAANGTALAGFDATNYGTVVDTVVDASALMESRGHQIEFIVCSPDVFKSLAKLDSGTNNELVLSRNNGSVDVPGIKASLFGIPVHVLASGTNVFTFTNSHALTVWESGVGRLTDTNLVNLTSAMSFFGFLGFAVTDATAIVEAGVVTV